ncbi:hypothetical protein C0R09_23035 [Brevibacillus laterosporus]|nr:hypothetical protein C0R09_23035 [Brevibacillus laterosporus]
MKPDLQMTASLLKRSSLFLLINTPSGIYMRYAYIDSLAPPYRFRYDFYYDIDYHYYPMKLGRLL